jgi:hypothetical protein
MEVALRFRPVIRPRGFGLSMASNRSASTPLYCARQPVIEL